MIRPRLVYLIKTLSECDFFGIRFFHRRRRDAILYSPQYPVFILVGPPYTLNAVLSFIFIFFEMFVSILFVRLLIHFYTVEVYSSNKVKLLITYKPCSRATCRYGKQFDLMVQVDWKGVRHFGGRESWN